MSKKSLRQDYANSFAINSTTLLFLVILIYKFSLYLLTFDKLSFWQILEISHLFKEDLAFLLLFGVISYHLHRVGLDAFSRLILFAVSILLITHVIIFFRTRAPMSVMLLVFSLSISDILNLIWTFGFLPWSAILFAMVFVIYWIISKGFYKSQTTIVPSTLLKGLILFLLICTLSDVFFEVKQPLKSYTHLMKNPFFYLLESDDIQITSEISLDDYIKQISSHNDTARYRCLGCNVIIINLEATAASDMQVYGNPVSNTPNLLSYLNQSAYFTNYYGNDLQSLKTNTAQIFGVYDYPQRRKYLRWNSYRFQKPTIMSSLKSMGYRTAYFNTGLYSYMYEFGFLQKLEFDLLLNGDMLEYKGFSIFDDCLEDTASLRYIFEWIDESPEPFFIYYDGSIGHNPQNVGGPFGQGADSGKENSIFYMDNFISLIYSHLHEKDLLDDTIIIVNADHGSKERDNLGLSEKSNNLPLIFINPPLFRNEIFSQVVSPIDIAPTVAQIVGAPTMDYWQGQNVFINDPKRVVFFSNVYIPESGLRQGDFKYIYNQDFKLDYLYNISDDPRQKRNLAGDYPTLVKHYNELLKVWIVEQKNYLDRK